MTTALEPRTLTKVDAAALRTADSVSFHGYKGEFHIRASIRELRRDVATFSRRQQVLFPTPDPDGSERKREITVRGHISGYGNDMTRWHGDENSTGFDMIHAARFAPTWTTVADLLREGDQLHLVFVADAHANQNSREAGLHVDTLELHVHRGDRRLAFLLDTGVYRDDSARMVKRYG